MVRITGVGRYGGADRSAVFDFGIELGLRILRGSFTVRGGPPARVGREANIGSLRHSAKVFRGVNPVLVRFQSLPLVLPKFEGSALGPMMVAGVAAKTPESKQWGVHFILTRFGAII